MLARLRHLFPALTPSGPVHFTGWYLHFGRHNESPIPGSHVNTEPLRLRLAYKGSDRNQVYDSR